MSSSEIKSSITEMLSKVTDERFLRTMHAMVSEYTGTNDFEFSQAEKKLLDERKKSHKAVRSKSYSVKQMKELVLKGLK